MEKKHKSFNNQIKLVMCFCHNFSLNFLEKNKRFIPFFYIAQMIDLIIHKTFTTTFKPNFYERKS